MSTISRVISKIAETILVLAILASLISLIAIAYIIYNEQFDKIYYYKPIIQYFLGIICLIGLITAIINSSLVFVTHLIHSTSSYLKNGNIPRSILYPI
jgi:Co/Zn/Cd efflux system component